MRRIDMVRLPDEWDGVLWFMDGKYRGHDDQFDPYAAVPDEGHLEVDLWSHRVRDDVPDDAVDGLIYAGDFSEVEEFLA